MKYLDYKVVGESEGCIIIQITKQKFRGLKFSLTNKGKVFESTNGIRIISFSVPDFYHKTLYIFGTITSKLLNNYQILIPKEIFSQVKLAIIEYNLVMEIWETS